MTKSKKRSFNKYSKSSAAVVSLGIHAILIVVAISFVAVTVIKKEEQKFEAKPVSRPKMQLKKLQVPVNIKKKKTQKPKLRKRIVVKPMLNKSMPDIKMPEMTGVKGGLGNAAGRGLGEAGSLGFSMPEVEMFGVKGKGEKVFLILDAGPYMMYDSMGGIPAYDIIKTELIRIIEELPPTVLFNLCVYENSQSKLLFPNLVSANSVNQAKVEEWLGPLNAVKRGMGSRDYGVRTLGAGGATQNEDTRVGPFEVDGVKRGGHDSWFRPAMLAMQQRADTVFLLTNGWGRHVYATSGVDESKWKGSAAEKKWNACFKKGLTMLDEENKTREEKGLAPRVLKRTPGSINGTYFTGIQRPPKPSFYNFTPAEFAEGFQVMRNLHLQDAAAPRKSGITKTKKRPDHFSFNVVQFIKEDGDGGKSEPLLRQLVSLCDGEFSSVQGLEAIQNYVTVASNGRDEF